jgi:delta-aminolevulinic acid dehydratase/porphobilinogen synthase
MPVEIRELVIKAIIAPPAEEDDEKPETGQSLVDRESIVQECVRQVMNILKKKEER